MLGLLAYLMRSNARLVEIDASVGQWGADHATHRSTQLLQLVTDLAEHARRGRRDHRRRDRRDDARSRTDGLPPFLVTVVVGEVVLVNTVKQLLDRVRPTLQPDRRDARPVVPERPLGDGGRALRGGRARARAAALTAHTGAARRRRPRRSRSAVACSRVMLGVHWLSDVIAGLAFGWAWFAVCAIALRRPVPRFGAPVEKADTRRGAACRSPPRSGTGGGSDVVEVALQRAEEPAAATRDAR